MSASNTSMLEGDRQTKGESSSRPNAHRNTSDREPFSHELLSLMGGSSGRATPPKSSQRSMANKVKGKNKKRRDDDYDSDAASSVGSLDELITEPNASGTSSNTAYLSFPATQTEPQARSSTSQQRQDSSSSIPSSSRPLPLLPKASTLSAQPQAAEQVASPAGTQSVFSPVDTPVNPRFNPNYLTATSNIAQLIRDFATPGDLVFGSSQNKPAGSQNVNNSNNASTKNPGQDNTNPFLDPPTPAYPNNPSTLNAFTTEPQTSNPFQQKTRTPEPQQVPVLNFNTNTQSSSRPRATKKLTADDLNARLDEEDDEPIGTAHSQPPTTRHTHIPNATPPTNNNASRTNNAYTRSSPSRRQSRVVDHGGNRLTIFPDDFDDYDFTINPETRDDDAQRGIYNPYMRNRQATPPWERRGSGHGAPRMDVDVPVSLIDWDAPLRMFDPQPQQQQRARPQTPPQRSAHPARSRTPAGAGTGHHSVDDDRLLAIQLAEEQKGMIMDQAVAMYLDRTLTPLDDCSFDNLVAHGLVDRDILELIEQLDTTALEAAAAAISSSPLRVPDSPLPMNRTDSPLGIPPPDARGKGKSTPVDDHEDAYTPLFATNINSTPQHIPAGSQNAFSAFIQTPAPTLAQTTTSTRSPAAPRSPSPSPPSPSPPAVTSNCGICFDTFEVVGAPREAANLATFATNAGKGKAVATAAASSASEYGVILPCSKSHAFCIDCLTQYIKSKLQDGISLDGKGFPIRCPGCNLKNSHWEADDDVAERVLDEETLEFWRRQKLLLNLPGMIYCPNSRCSELLERPDDLEADANAAQCPWCTCSLCFQCGSLWHPDLTCKENEALKEHEDKEIYIMSKKQHWRRCPKCKMLVEKNDGCHHMTCRCGFEFCWLCGKIYGSGGCGGNCGQWVQDPNLITLPTPGYDADQGGPSTVHVNNSTRPQPQVRHRRPLLGRAMLIAQTRRPQQHPVPSPLAQFTTDFIPPWSRP